MAIQRALTIIDIPWLRRAAQKSGALLTPQGIAERLLAGGLVQLDINRECLTITKRGQLALTKLG